MSLTLDYDFLPPALPCTVCKLDGARMVARAARRLCAAALWISALAIWIAPGATWESDIMLLKLLLSLSAMLGAASLWLAGTTPELPTVEIDLHTKELRMLRGQGRQPRKLIERCAFRDLDRAELENGQIAFWARDGRLLVGVSLTNATAHAALLAALRAEGKLAKPAG
ncbi:hypothetical protein ABMC89_02395 [Sulfitobacter sp. HNIBRBA3233]|uniref:hypothetical protein n=1 Tax=Sulfitobacter marinivivus TaxID=3158558 RepID=UPI0032DE96CE